MSHKPECNQKWQYDKDHCICRWIDKAEQRIVDLLESLKADCVCDDCRPHQERNAHYLTAIQELIKGENK